MEPEFSPADDTEDAELPDWAQRVLSRQKPVMQAAGPTVKDLVGGPAWPALLKAAVVSSFVPRELAIRKRTVDEEWGSAEEERITAKSERLMEKSERRAAEDRRLAMQAEWLALEAERVALDEKQGAVEEESKDVQAAVLGFAERVYDPKGSKWALTQDARRTVLAAASKPEINEAIEWAKEYEFNDPISVALRGQLSGQHRAAEVCSLPTLEAARIAAQWLGDVQDGAAPTLETLDREVAFRRLLKPFYRMVGVDEPEGRAIDASKIRFFGRDEAMGQLREYVGFAPSAGILGAAIGYVSSLAVGNPLPLVVWGVGGVGKTTLIAKFAIDQAEEAHARYPFAYLDFDRATLSPRRPALLLIEMCQQLIAQFPELAGVLDKVQREARAQWAKLEISSDKISSERVDQELYTFDHLSPLLKDFRETVDSHIAALEGTWEVKRPFVLIFDTFEIVQYSDFDVACIERFIQKLSNSDDGRGWARLRLIVSGRKRPLRFLKGFTEIELGALDRAGSVQMLQMLTQDVGRPLGQQQAEQLIDEIVAAVRQPKAKGLSPLRLRLLGDVFDRAPETDGNVIAGQLIDEIKSAANTGARLGKAFIDGILIRRILDYVADWRVRELADPGLVVRRITADVIRNVMAKGTPKPPPLDEGENEDREKLKAALEDGTTFEPWQLSPEEAQDIFEAFSSEVRLVDSDEFGLRHRQDVRQDMLPLIRLRRPKRFMQLHTLAYEYFRNEVKKNASDQLSRAEAIYHGLWCGVPLDDIERMWPKVPGFEPRLDASEFEDMPVAWRYIRAKARQPLTADEIAALPRSVAVEWVVSREDTFLQDGNPNQVVRTVGTAAGEAYEGLDTHVGTAAIVARLLYRTGQWSDSHRLIARHLIDSGRLEELLRMAEAGLEAPTGRSNDPDDLLSLLRTWATMSAKVGADRQPFDVAAIASDKTQFPIDPVTRIELLSYAVLGNRMLKERSEWSSDFMETSAGNVMRMATAVQGSAWRQNVRTLRCAILAAHGDIGPLLATYLRSGGVSTLDGDALPTAAQALAIFYDAIDQESAAREMRSVAERAESDPNVAIRLQQLWQEGGARLADIVVKDRKLQNLVKKVVVFDHHDWARPLGNALTRFFDKTDGEALRAALQEQGFVADSVSRGAGFDGPSIALRAVSRGKLLQLAETIDHFSDQYVGAPNAALEAAFQSASYPETVFGIAEALLLWHDIHLEAAGDLKGGGEAESEAELAVEAEVRPKPKSKSRFRKSKAAPKKKRSTKRKLKKR
jgi:hypothetical protein